MAPTANLDQKEKQFQAKVGEAFLTGSAVDHLGCLLLSCGGLGCSLGSDPGVSGAGGGGFWDGPIAGPTRSVASFSLETGKGSKQEGPPPAKVRCSLPSALRLPGPPASSGGLGSSGALPRDPRLPEEAAGPGSPGGRPQGGELLLLWEASPGLQIPVR